MIVTTVNQVDEQREQDILPLNTTLRTSFLPE